MIRSLQLPVFASLVIATIFAGSGCETDPSQQITLAISPNNVEIRAGESQVFTASGWQDYTWQIVGQDDSSARNGVLSTTKGDRTVYTAITEGPQTVVLRVQAIRTSVSTDPTNETGTFAESAEAVITHLEPETTEDGA